MATIYNTIVVSHDETTANDQRDLYAETGLSMLAGRKLSDFIDKTVSGQHPAVVLTRINAVRATGSITLISHVATDTVTVNGITLTCVASGATGPQYNVGGSDAITADNLAATINANATLLGMIVATSLAGVVTLNSILPGAIGNALTLAISAHGGVSAARMAGGTNGDQETYHYFGSSSAY